MKYSFSCSEQENRALRTNTLPNPCWSQRSKEKCKSKVTPTKSVLLHPPTPTPTALSLYPPYLFSLPFQEGCHFHYSHGKVLSALDSKVLRNFRKSLAVTVYLSSLSGTHPVHSRLRNSKNCHLQGFGRLCHVQCPRAQTAKTVPIATLVIDEQK